MKSKVIICSLCGIIALTLQVGNASAQKKNGVPHDTKFSGYPTRDPGFDVRPGFLNPPKGYGNVPFFWWNGDTLSRARLTEQLDILKESATDGFAVSYLHTDPKGADYEFNKKNGYGLYGRTEAGNPAVYSDEWWKTWNWFSGEAAKRGMAVGLDDYTIGWVGNGYSTDEVRDLDKFKSYKGALTIKVDSIIANASLKITVPPNVVSITAWPVKTGSAKFIDLKNKVKNGTVAFKAPKGADWKVYTVLAGNNYMLHPDHGKELVKHYFQRFEDKMDAQGRKGMNYFFQDELFVPFNMNTWSEDFAQQFNRIKGYDVLPYLAALKENIGAITPKIRMDYADVLMELAEERYFKPIYDWHASRGLIYGSDNLDRGLEPLNYVDYFRVESWYTAPGNDAPARGSSFIQTKVSSSVAHLYKRPRTWLEAFHSMGWGSSGEWLTEQLDHHFIAGGNLICMHGLYYTTHGGWWEWAPPDFHYRMPYWPHMKKWLEYGERLSFVMSQGTHVSDIALMYPTESMQAFPGTRPNVSFATAKILSNAGLDYDFMDYRSLLKTEISDKSLKVSDMAYKILILPDMKAMHYTALQQVLNFYRKGGIVVATGALPVASTRKGSNDPEVDAIVKEIFGLTAKEQEAGKKTGLRQNASGGKGLLVDTLNIATILAQHITPDFIPGEGGGKVLHRKIGDKDLYMTMNVKPGNEVFYRMQGRPELWDAKTGQTKVLPVVKQTKEGTFIRSDVGYTNSSIIVFSPGQAVIENKRQTEAAAVEKKLLDGDWKIEFLPTMNNKWGDFRLPASAEKISTEARTFKFNTGNKVAKDWTTTAFSDQNWEEGIYDYGYQMQWLLDSTEKNFDKLIQKALGGKLNTWKPYHFSWRFGVWDHPGPQGYHGLKARVNDGFLILDGAGSHLFSTFVYAPKSELYQVELGERQPDRFYVDGQLLQGKEIQLTKGWHAVLAGYENVPKKGFKVGPNSRDERPRSAIVFLPASSPLPEKVSPYAKTLAMRWYNAPKLMFDPGKGENKTYCYRFKSAPGLEKMEMGIYGNNPKIWIDGKALSSKNIELLKTEHGLNTYRVTLSEKKEKVALVAMEIENQIGIQDVAVFPFPIKLFCTSGLLPAGDWAETGQMRHYSGGLYYRKTIPMTTEQLKGKVTLDLGEVVATCAVKVNGKEVVTMMSKPYKADISSFLKAGDNEVEVLVYSTLSNHYQTIPSAYRGNPRAGLLGPVYLELQK
ncbi:Glycosyl hydrolases family 2, sugar binding domain [Pedobacter sp. ok626]|uniref:glycosyl hydrolase n=1 Tax=Pedobacter sp. ok626 TaxID=1761882 RepID=UPI00088C8866|nr:glycosyl hydrolase [Pedobacter sp. ok626]SDK96637.1 Glycosyl hydrolases family 2, sugar binding domain [Pedobacter sp. ok626]